MSASQALSSAPFVADRLLPLRGDGRRGWRRIDLDASCGLTVKVQGASGWSLRARTPTDISMGGIGLSIGYFEEGRIRVGEDILLSCTLRGREFNVKARAMHLSKTEGRFVDVRMLGVQFSPGASFDAVRALLASFMLGLLRETGESVG